MNQISLKHSRSQVGAFENSALVTDPDPYSNKIRYANGIPLDLSRQVAQQKARRSPDYSSYGMGGNKISAFQSNLQSNRDNTQGLELKGKGMVTSDPMQASMPLRRRTGSYQKQSQEENHLEK